MNEEGIVVLSVCDGISCGKLAYERANIKVSKYIASEIKRSAIKCSKCNHDDIIHVGDITKLSYKDGILHYEGGQLETEIDMLIGGTPCQDFSIAKTSWINSENYKYGLDGDSSSLFYHYLRLLKEVNPTYFLLENVKMKIASKKELDEYLGVEGLYINSELVSYQNRPRYYWTNIEGVKPPKDKGINFQDYKETDYEVCKEYRLKETMSRIRMWNNGEGRVAKFKGDHRTKYCDNITYKDKIGCLTRKQDRSPNSGLIEFEDFCRFLTRKEIEQAQTLPVGYTDCLSYRQMQNVCGDGWTVDVIAHIFSYLPDTYKVETE